MSVKYSIAQIKNPQRPDEPAKFYARAQVREEVSLDRIAEEISWGSTLTSGDILNVLSALISKLNEHLSDGDLVSLGNFGKFQYQLSSKASDTYEEVIAANIRKTKVQFRPGKMLKNSLTGLTYERVLSVKARKAAAKKAIDDSTTTPEEE